MDPVPNPECRLCLTSPGPAAAMTLLNHNPYFIDSIRTITSVEVLLASDPHRSVFMCSSCQDALEQCIRFRNRCVESDGVFKGRYEKQGFLGVKEEPLDEEEEERVGTFTEVKVEMIVTPDLGDNLEDHFGEVRDEAESDEWELAEPEPEVEVPKKQQRRGKKKGDVGVKEEVVAKDDGASKEEAIPMAQCQLCGKIVKKVTLTAHLSTHNPNRRKFICPYCEKVFYNSLKLKNHVNGVHTHLEKYACEVCGKAYERTDTLRIHFLAEHTDEKRYECKQCGMRFARESGRRYHILKEHTVGKPFQCEYCEKSFKRKPDLTLHVRTHTGEKPFNCDICGKAFSKSYNVVIHKKSHQRAQEAAAAAAATTATAATVETVPTFP